MCRHAFLTVDAGLPATGLPPPAASLALTWRQAYENAIATSQPAAEGSDRNPIPQCRSVLGQVHLALPSTALPEVQRGAPTLFRMDRDPAWNPAALAPHILLHDLADEDVQVAGIPYADVFGGKGGLATFREFEIYMNATFSTAAQTGVAWHAALIEATAMLDKDSAACNAGGEDCTVAAAPDRIVDKMVNRLCGAYINTESDACAVGEGGEECGPLYIFDTEIASRRLLPDSVSWPAMLNQTYAGITPVFQFGLGPACAGAPFHFHEDAWNVLFAGAKLWWLRPPQERTYSKLPPARVSMTRAASGSERWTGLRGTGGGGDGNGVLCIQQPGDLIFVPRHWAHQTLNLQLGVGLAGEYSITTHPPWLLARK